MRVFRCPAVLSSTPMPIAWRTLAGRVRKAVSVPPEVAQEIRYRYEQMGRGTVAVRSSATAEDLAAASMAGQCETFLDISGDEALLEAVRNCWASLHTERIRAYLHEHGIDQSLVAMAVVVQRLDPGGCGGSAFYRRSQWRAAQRDADRRQLGIGRDGRRRPRAAGCAPSRRRHRPSSLRFDRRQDGLSSGGRRRGEARRGVAPKTDLPEQPRCPQLWQLGKQAEHYFGAPQDTEWAIHDGKLHLLQARPITTQSEIEAKQEVMTPTREHLRNEIARQRGPWALHNLAETLPHPTPSRGA